MSYPKNVGIINASTKWNGNCVLKIEANIQTLPSPRGVVFIYNFRTGELLSIEKLASTAHQGETVYHGLNCSEYDYTLISKNLKEVAAVGREKLEKFKKLKSKKTEDEYNKILGPWKAAGELKNNAFTKLDTTNSGEFGGAEKEDLDNILEFIKKLAEQPGGPWAADVEVKEKPKKQKPVDYTAHCRFNVFIKDCGEFEEAAEIFRHSKLTVKGKYMDVSNWREVGFLPPKKTTREREWIVPVYVKIFFTAKDVDKARRELDQLYPKITTCWDNGIEKSEDMQVCSTDAWSFSILPSQGKDTEYSYRYHLSWPWNKIWQRLPENYLEERIDSSTPFNEAVSMVLRQYTPYNSSRIGLTARELTYILNQAGGENLTEGRKVLEHDKILEANGVTALSPQEDDDITYVYQE